jgi:hypothetical protein
MAARITIDSYIIDSLMPDLVGHDRQPSAFVVYLYLYRRGRSRRAVTVSLQQIASETGVSKSAVQQALRTLKRRRLVQATSRSATAAPDYQIRTPWIRSGPRQTAS